MPLLEDRFRVVSLNLPGLSLSMPDPISDYSDQRSVAVLAARTDRVGIGEVAVVGSCTGGRIAWRFAAAGSARVSDLVPMTPDGFAKLGCKYGRAPERLRWLMRLLPYTAPKPFLGKTMCSAYAVPGVLTDAVVDRYSAMLLTPPGVRRAIPDRVLQMRLVPPEPILLTMRAAVLLLGRERDGAVPASHAADQKCALPNVRTVILPRSGHMPMKEAPEVSATALRAFPEAAAGTLRICRPSPPPACRRPQRKPGAAACPLCRNQRPHCSRMTGPAICGSCAIAYYAVCFWRPDRPAPERICLPTSQVPCRHRPGLRCRQRVTRRSGSMSGASCFNVVAVSERARACLPSRAPRLGNACVGSAWRARRRNDGDRVTAARRAGAAGAGR